MISPYHIHFFSNSTDFLLFTCMSNCFSKLYFTLGSVFFPSTSLYSSLSGRSNVPTHNTIKPSRYKQLPINNWLAAMIPGPHRCLLSPDGVCGTSNIVYTRHM